MAKPRKEQIKCNVCKRWVDIDKWSLHWVMAHQR
jgi:hypothetical protein